MCRNIVQLQHRKMFSIKRMVSINLFRFQALNVQRFLYFVVLRVAFDFQLLHRSRSRWRWTSSACFWLVCFTSVSYVFAHMFHLRCLSWAAVAGIRRMLFLLCTAPTYQATNSMDLLFSNAFILCLSFESLLGELFCHYRSIDGPHMHRFHTDEFNQQ